MATSSYFCVEVSQKDLPAILEKMEGWFDAVNDHSYKEGVAKLEIYSAAYGGCDAIDALVELGFPFVGYFEGFDHVHESLFAFDGKDYEDVIGDVVNRFPYAVVGHDGRIVANDAINYLAVYGRAMEKIRPQTKED